MDVPHCPKPELHPHELQKGPSDLPWPTSSPLLTHSSRIGFIFPKSGHGGRRRVLSSPSLHSEFLSNSFHRNVAHLVAHGLDLWFSQESLSLHRI